MKKLKFLTAIFAISLLSCNHDDDHITQNPVTSVNDEIIMCTFDFVNSHNNYTSKPGAAIINSPRWDVGQTIKVKFLDGSNLEQEIFKQYVSQWTAYANLNFEYVPKNEDAHIIVAFNLGRPGAWSELGARMLLPSPTWANYQNTPSMRVGPVSNSESSRRTVLHEFGHALGLVHEQNNPDAKINWNLPKTYKYYYDLMDWSKEEVDRQVIQKRSPQDTDYSTYDPLSIMHYYVPASLTTDGVGVNEQSYLSWTDKKSINKWYPFPIRSNIEPEERIDLIDWAKRIQSPNGKYSLEFFFGLLHIIDNQDNTIIWEVGNPFYDKKNSCYLESNGNLIVKGKQSNITGVERTTWSSNTSEFPGAKLHLQNDGNLVLIYNGTIKWSSKSGKL